MQSLISGALFFFLVPGREDFLVSYGWFKMSQIPHRYLRHPFGKETVVRQWHLIDADGIPVGRLACQIAKLLLGKHKPIFDPSKIYGDYVVVKNCEKVAFTGKKWTRKHYRWHTGYPGGLKEISAKRLLEKHPPNVIARAVRGMLPKNRLRDKRMKLLKIYVGDDHPHSVPVCTAVGDKLQAHKDSLLQKSDEDILKDFAGGYRVHFEDTEDSIEMHIEDIPDPRYEKQVRKQKIRELRKLYPRLDIKKLYPLPKVPFGEKVDIPIFRRLNELDKPILPNEKPE